MSAVRIIPRLDIKGPNLVKGIHLEGLRVLGDPQAFAKYYYEQGADEIFYMDVVASLYERNSLSQIIQSTAENIFVPITVGGGIRTLQDIGNVLKSGADKVCINTAAHKNPNFIREASLEFGSSTIVVALEAIKQPNGEYLLFVDNGREETARNAISWAQEVESLGAGEIVLTSVDREGTGEGYDIDLIKNISQSVSIPVVAHGGAKDSKDIYHAIQAGSDGVAISSILHYKAIHEITNHFDKGNNKEGNTRFLESKQGYGKISPISLPEIKKSLVSFGVACRYE